MTDVKEHPYRALLLEAAREREVVESPEGQVLQEAIFSAVRTYSEFLDRHDLIFDDDRLKASALVVTLDYGIDPGTIDISLKDGATDRVYGNGFNPDPEGQGPADIPHKYRPDGDDGSFE
jgi:hypothetical protein